MENFLLCLVLFTIILLLLIVIFGGIAFIAKNIIKKITKDKYKVNVLFLAMLIFFTIVYISILYSIIFEHQSYIFMGGGLRHGLGPSQTLNLITITAFYFGLIMLSFRKK